MRISTLFFLSTLCLTPLALSQTRNIAWFKDNSPTLGSGNAFPWGSVGIRYQAIVPGSLFKNRPALIQDILVAGRKSDIEIVYGDIEIRMGITKQTTPTGNWKTNNPKPMTVYRGSLRVKLKVGKWAGIGLPSSYMFLPTSKSDNLCIEVIVWKVLDKGNNNTSNNFYHPISGTSASPGGSIPRAFLYQWTSKQSNSPYISTSMGNKMGFLLFGGNVVFLGKGCKGSSGNTPEITTPVNSWPKVGTPYTLNLTGGTPANVVLFLLGRKDTKWGTISLPFKLGPAGAPGCHIWNEILNFYPRPVTPQGKASMVIPIPNLSELIGVRLFGSWVNLDKKANKLGLITSNYAKMIIGT